MTPWTVACQAPLSMGIPQARILEWVAISFFRGIFPNQGLNLGLLHCRQEPAIYCLSHQGSPENTSVVFKRLKIELVYDSLYIPKRPENKYTHESLYMNVHSSRILKSPKVETREVLMDEWVKKR